MSDSDGHGQGTPRGIVWEDVPDDCPECGAAVIVDDQAAMYCENSVVEFDGGCEWEPLEAPMECPECGDEQVFGDGCAFTCNWCGFEWGTPSGRGAVNRGESLETGVNAPDAE